MWKAGSEQVLKLKNIFTGKWLGKYGTGVLRAGVVGRFGVGCTSLVDE